MIRSLAPSIITNAVYSLIDGGFSLFSAGILLETSDGDVLYTTDDALMTLGGPQAQSATRPPVLLYTTDNATLFTIDNDTLTV